MANRLLLLWKRLSAWVEGMEPENHGRRGDVGPATIRSTHALERESLADAARPGEQSQYYNRTLVERFADWDAVNGLAFFERLYKIVTVFICLSLISVLLITVSFLPAFGHPENPINNEVFVKYIQDTLKDTNATNVVAGIILDYRAFDTFGEATVLFVASCAVAILLREDDKKSRKSRLESEMDAPRKDVILLTVSKLAIPVILLYGIYVILNGHISPGGGFSGGTVIGAGLMLYLSAFGTAQVNRLISYRTYRNINFFSLSFYGLAKGYSFYFGANHLETGIPHGTPGAILSGGLILPLNIAVGLVVACTMYGFYALFSKGEI